MQSKKQSTLESIGNTVVGLFVSIGIQFLIYPALNIDVSINQNFILTGVFFLVSFIRNYLTRRLFNRVFKKTN
jgi:high-affinity Fe2+/Pb2+ permease